MMLRRCRRLLRHQALFLRLHHLSFTRLLHVAFALESMRFEQANNSDKRALNFLSKSVSLLTVFLPHSRRLACCTVLLKVVQ